MSETATHVLLDQARRAEYAGRFDEALALYQQAAGRADDPLASDARLKLGRLLVLLRRHDEALPLLQGLLDQAQADHAPRKRSVAANLLALLHRPRDPEQARRLLEQYSPVSLPGAPGPELGQWLHYRGLLEQDRGELAEAERLFYRALEYYEESQYLAGQAEVYDSLANLLLRHARIRPALEFARRSLKLKEEISDLYGQAISHGTIGRACQLQARFDEAIAAYQRDLALARQLNDQRGIGQMLNTLGEVELLRGRIEAARQWYEQARQYREGGAMHQAHSCLGLARVHLKEGQLDAAQALANEMASLLAGLSPPAVGLAALLDGLCGSIAWRRGRTDEGEQLLQKAIATLQGAKHVMDSLPLLTDLRDLYHETGRTANAVLAMSHALDLLAECGADEQVSGLEEWLRKIDQSALVRLALERHFPSHLIDGILSGNLTRKQIDQLTRRQEVTILFSDLRNYTKLSEGLEPEAVMGLLNEWFAEVTQLIRQHGGFVDKFIGDAVMALYGVPEPRDSSGADAVRTALAMRDALRARNLRARALGEREIQIGIGIHTGSAVVGFLGSHLRLSYTAIGDTVNVASRLESATKAFHCDILISEATQQAQARHGVAETRYVGKAELKGHSEIPVYEILGRLGGSSFASETGP